MDLWFGLLEENIQANGGTAMAPENYTRVKVGFNTLSSHDNFPMFSHNSSSLSLNITEPNHIDWVGVRSPEVGYKKKPNKKNPKKLNKHIFAGNSLKSECRSKEAQHVFVVGLKSTQ